MLLETFIKYPVIFFSGLLASLALTPLWIRFARYAGFLDQPGGRKIHDKPLPVGGGIAVFIGFHVACAVIFLFPWKPFSSQISIDWWFRFIPLSVGVIALGLTDDRWGMPPWVKLIGQISLALLAYLADIRVNNTLGMGLPEWIDFCVTLVWFLVIMNSINLIDGIDGLATGIVLIASLGIGVSLVFRSSPGDVLLFVGFAGACLGFLRYNFYPALVFLGDTGSLFLGFTLAALTVSTSSKGSAVTAIGVPLLAVGVPLFDTALAVWRHSVRRVLSGQDGNKRKVAIDQADSDHLHHRLLRRMEKHSRVAWILYAATALLALTGVLTTVFNDRALGILGIAFVITVYTVFRHLVWIELRDTGEVVLRGIAKPVRRNLSLIFYIFADLVILNLAWFASVLLLNMYSGTGPFPGKTAWLHAVPVDITIPLLFLMLFRSYSKAWSLAGVVEYLTVGWAGFFGCIAATAVSLLYFSPEKNLWTVVLQKTVFFGFSVPFIVGIRAFPRTVQGLMSCNRAGSLSEKSDLSRLLVGGSGGDLVLYFRYRATGSKNNDKTVVCGVVTEDRALRGHYINGVRVLGTLNDLPALIHSGKYTDFIWVGELTTQQRLEIYEVLKTSGVRFINWSVVEKEISAAGLYE